MTDSSVLLPCTHSSYRETASLSQPYPLPPIQQSKLSQNMAGQTVSDHVRTAISQIMLIYVHQNKEMAH